MKAAPEKMDACHLKTDAPNTENDWGGCCPSCIMHIAHCIMHTAHCITPDIGGSTTIAQTIAHEIMSTVYNANSTCTQHKLEALCCLFFLLVCSAECGLEVR